MNPLILLLGTSWIYASDIKDLTQKCMTPFSETHPMRDRVLSQAEYVTDGYTIPLFFNDSNSRKVELTLPKIALNYLAAFLGYIPTNEGFARNHHVDYTSYDYRHSTEAAGFAYINGIVALSYHSKAQQYYKDRFRDLVLQASEDLIADLKNNTELREDQIHNILNIAIQLHKLCHWLELKETQLDIYDLIDHLDTIDVPFPIREQLIMTYYLSEDIPGIMKTADLLYEEINLQYPTPHDKAIAIYADTAPKATSLYSVANSGIKNYELLLLSYALAKSLKPKSSVSRKINANLNFLHLQLSELPDILPDLLITDPYLNLLIRSSYYQGRYKRMFTLSREPIYELPISIPSLSFEFSWASHSLAAKNLKEDIGKLTHLRSLSPEIAQLILPILIDNANSSLRNELIHNFSYGRLSLAPDDPRNIHNILSTLVLLAPDFDNTDPTAMKSMKETTDRLLVELLDYPFQKEPFRTYKAELFLDDFDQYVLPAMKRIYKNDDPVVKRWIQKLKDSDSVWWKRYITEVSGVNARRTHFRDPPFLNRFGRDGWLDPGLLMGMRFFDQVEYTLQLPSVRHRSQDTDLEDSLWEEFARITPVERSLRLAAIMKNVRRSIRGPDANGSTSLNLYLVTFAHLSRVILEMAKSDVEDF